MSVSGKKFCSSAWEGWLLNLKHLMTFYFAQTLASVFILMGMFVIIILDVGLGYLILT